MLLPSCISSKPLLISVSRMVCVIIGSISIFPSMYQSTIFGTSVRPRAAECRALHNAAGAQLEWGGRDSRARRGDADDDGLAPPTMARLQRLAHHRDIAGAVEGVIGAADLVGPALGHVDEMPHQIAAGLFRIDEMRHAEALAPFLFAVVDVDADDHVSAGKPQALDDIEADAPKP